MEKWPNFFIVGAPKAGTTSLYEYLKKNPDIYMSPVKEPHYFSDVPQGSLQIKDKKNYLDLFKDVKGEIAIGEASTTYLGNPNTPKKIHDVIPHAKIIIILRDPIEQYFSGYLMNREQEKIKLSFHDKVINDFGKNPKPVIDKNSNGFSDQIKRYLDFFDKEQIKIIIFEEFVRNPKKVVEEVYQFLGVSDSLDNFESKAYNQYTEKKIPRGKISNYLVRKGIENKIPNKIVPLSFQISFADKFLKKSRKKSKPQMSNEDKEILVKVFQNDVENLKNILGRDFPWSNF